MTGEQKIIAGEVYHKLLKGDAINDSELQVSIKVFEDLAGTLSVLGDKFSFVEREIVRVLDRLMDFSEARKRYKN